MRSVPVFLPSPSSSLRPVHSVRASFPPRFPGVSGATASISGWAASKGPHSGDLLLAAAAAEVPARGRGQTASEQQTYSQLLPSNKKKKKKKTALKRRQACNWWNIKVKKKKKIRVIIIPLNCLKTEPENVFRMERYHWRVNREEYLVRSRK